MALRRRVSASGAPVGGAAVRRRRSRLMVVLLLFVALFVALLATAASAEPSKDPAPAPSTSVPAPPATGGLPTPEPTTTALQDLKPGDADAGILQPFNITGPDGVPLSAYSVKADTSSGLMASLTGGASNVQENFSNWLAEFFFSIAKYTIGFACRLLQWALGFGLSKVVAQPAETVSNKIRDQLILRLGLPGLFMMFAALYAIWHVMFKQRSRGFAEAGTSIVIAALTITVLVSPVQVLLGTDASPKGQSSACATQRMASPGGSDMLLSDSGLIGKARLLSIQVAALVLNRDAQQTTTDACGQKTDDALAASLSTAVSNQMVQTFIIEPDELMLYGETFDPQTACGKAFSQYNLVLYRFTHTGAPFWDMMMAQDPAGNTAYQELKGYGDKFSKACQGQGKKLKSRKANMELVFSTLFVAIAAVIVSILVILITGTFLIAQGWITIEAIRGYWALTAGILPGGGRSVLWKWCAAIVKAALSVIYSILGLAIFILIVQALMDADIAGGPAIKFIVIDIACLAALGNQKRIRERASKVAENVNNRLNREHKGGPPRIFKTDPPGQTTQLLGDISDGWSKSGRPAAAASRKTWNTGKKAFAKRGGGGGGVTATMASSGLGMGGKDGKDGGGKGKGGDGGGKDGKKGGKAKKVAGVALNVGTAAAAAATGGASAVATTGAKQVATKAAAKTAAKTAAKSAAKTAAKSTAKQTAKKALQERLVRGRTAGSGQSSDGRANPRKSDPKTMQRSAKVGAQLRAAKKRADAKPDNRDKSAGSNNADTGRTESANASGGAGGGTGDAGGRQRGGTRFGRPNARPGGSSKPGDASQGPGSVPPAGGADDRSAGRRRRAERPAGPVPKPPESTDS